MIKIRATEDELELSGSPAELQHVRAMILALTRGTESESIVSADSDCDPKPYDVPLSELRLVRDVGPTRVSVVGRALRVSGADENLEKFSSWFDFDEEVETGAHNHFDYFPGNTTVAPDSRSLVVSAVTAAQQRA